MWYRMDHQGVVFQFPEDAKDFFCNLSKICVVSGCCCGLNEIFAVLRCYTAEIGS